MPHAPDLEFFYDCSSPWSYFAFTRIQPMAQALGVPVHWRPILVGGVFNAVNQELYAAREAMFKGENPRRLDYYLKDMQDWADLCGLQIQMPPGHPLNSVKAMRGALHALDKGLVVPYSQAVFATYWSGENPDVSDDAVLGAICESVGLDTADFFATISGQACKDRLRANTDELIARGGFGSPTLFIDGNDMYFGNDRLPLVESRLRERLNPKESRAEKSGP